jgi:hypothetical protein
MKYITNTNAIILIIDGKNIKVEKTDKKYAKIVKVFQLPVEEQESAVLEILNPNPVPVLLHSISEQNAKFDFINECVYYNGEKLPTAFAQKVKSIVRDGLPLENFELFWKNLSDNPSSSSVKELIDFLEYKELPITEDGCFLAYKAVKEDYYSISGNIETKVISGTVNEAGQIYNGIGEDIEVLRRDVDDNRSVGCSTGLHAGSLDYARGYGSKLIVVKINPKDVVSVPSDCSCQKCRVCRYIVVSDFVEEIESSVTDENGVESAPSATKERTALIDRIEQYLNNKEDAGWDEVTVRQIQNSLSPLWITKQEVLDALQDLGYWWGERGTAIVVSL